jgi:hypothetical protein
MIRRLLQGLARVEYGRRGRHTRRWPSTRHHWRCECGARSRKDGFLIRSDAEYAAQRHQLSKAVGHPVPETYSTDGMLS